MHKVNTRDIKEITWTSPRGKFAGVEKESRSRTGEALARWGSLP